MILIQAFAFVSDEREAAKRPCARLNENRAGAVVKVCNLSSASFS